MADAIRGVRQRRALVTGGAGFIGANVADRLLREGRRVTVLDSLARPGVSRNLAWLQARHGSRLELVRADVRDARAVEAAVRGSDVVYHLAAQTAVTSSIDDPRTDFEINAAGTVNVLEAARVAAPEAIVLFSSTNKVYGAMEDLAVVEAPTRYRLPDHPDGIDERRPLDFHSPYGCSKGAADQYVRDYAHTYGLRTVVFRQSCVYGERQLGTEDQGWLAWFVIAAARKAPITIFGDGKQVRDLLHIEDLLDCYEAAIERIDRAAGRVYNVGGGPANAVSVWPELAPLLAERCGAAPKASFAPWRRGDQRVFVADTAQARRDLGWQPRVGVQAGLARLADWVQRLERSSG